MFSIIKGFWNVFYHCQKPTHQMLHLKHLWTKCDSATYVIVPKVKGQLNNKEFTILLSVKEQTGFVK